MVVGSVMASFQVEEFSLERVRRLNPGEIVERFESFRRLTRFGEQDFLDTLETRSTPR